MSVGKHATKFAPYVAYIDQIWKNYSTLWYFHNKSEFNYWFEEKMSHTDQISNATYEIINLKIRFPDTV